MRLGRSLAGLGWAGPPVVLDVAAVVQVPLVPVVALAVVLCVE